MTVRGPALQLGQGRLWSPVLGFLLFILAVDPLTHLLTSNSSVLQLYANVYYKLLLSTADLLALQEDVDIISLWIDTQGLYQAPCW